MLGFWIHELAVGLLVPPGVAEEGVHEEVTLVHVAGHALGARDGAGELVFDRVALLLFGDHGVGGEREPLVAELGERAGVGRRAVVGVGDVAGGAAGGAEVARVVVAAHEIEQRVVQAGFLEIEVNGVDAVEGAEAALGEAAGGAAGGLEGVGVAQLGLFLAAALEDAEDVGRLAEGVARERFEEGKEALGAGHLGRDRDGRLEAERGAVDAVGLAVARVFLGRGAVVVEGGAPEHGAVAHDGVADVGVDLGVAGAAGLLGHAEIAGVDELDELGGLVVEQDRGVGGVGGGGPEVGVARGDVGLAHGEAGGGVAAVAVDAAEHDVRRLVHGLDVGVALDAAGGFAVGVGVGLVDQGRGGI